MLQQVLFDSCGLGPGSHILCAVSGGADSVALLLLLRELRDQGVLRLSAAHFEHGIRGEESLEDARFVKALCKGWRIPLETGQGQVPQVARQRRQGLEETARIMRHAFLEEARQRCGAQVIALAHHRRDQAETVLLHLARGCDLAGACGMRFRSGRLIRPLLYTAPEELREMLLRRGQPWREDPTNREVQYARNRVRERVLPELSRVNPRLEEALCRFARACQRDEDCFDTWMEGLSQGLELPRGRAFPRAVLTAQHPALVSRLLCREMAAAHLPAQRREVVEALTRAIGQGECGAWNLEGPGRAQLSPGALMILREEPLPEPVRWVPGQQIPGLGELDLLPQGGTGDGITCQRVPARCLHGARVRPAAPGLRCVPFGSEREVDGWKLLQSCGLPAPLREGVPVLEDAGGQVLWLCGVRACAPCRAEDEEETVMLGYPQGGRLTALTGRPQGGRSMRKETER